MKTPPGVRNPDCFGQVEVLVRSNTPQNAFRLPCRPRAKNHTSSTVFGEFGAKHAANALSKINTDFCWGKVIGFGLKN